MDRSKTRQVNLLVSLIFIVLVGIYYVNVNGTSDITSECEITEESCVFKGKNGIINVKFLQAPVIEEELRLKFTVFGDVKIINVWVEGINMYMGKTPVIFEDNPNIGITFLGACHLSEMKWRLNIEAENKEGEVLKYSAFFFTTQ